ncbi:MAG: type III-B CRISPR module RAMP protein Cmr4 [Fusobacterium sp. JB019]|nr:type III-B CRISPR module RAMP protein Cmr4 [Fusobacterium sp. JB019]
MSTEMNRDLYIIECVTNLHVGSGDNDFGLIDNRVQRDVITGYPTINASSLKGAFASHFNNEKDKKRTKEGEAIFGRGNDTKKDEDKNFIGQGKYKFFPANLLAIPVRSSSRPYYLVTSDQIIEDYNEIHTLFKGEESNLKSNKDNKKENLDLEGEEVKAEKINFREKDIYVIEDKEFSKIVENLPVIARNHLDNGESKNLWYEEIVPRKSIFYFGIDKGVAEEGTKYEEDFNNEILFEYKDSEGNKKGEKNIIHIGGNVTVGFGACKIMKLGDIND